MMAINGVPVIAFFLTVGLSFLFYNQAFKITPINREVLDKLLTESLKNNIPASGLHLFGINQVEEENTIASK